MDEDECGYCGFGDQLVFQRIALNMPQINAIKPPKNPAKITDSRSTGYIAKYGASSWELDAIPPQQLRDIITDAIDGFIDDKAAWDDAKEDEAEQRRKMRKFSREWEQEK